MLRRQERRGRGRAAGRCPLCCSAAATRRAPGVPEQVLSRFLSALFPYPLSYLSIKYFVRIGWRRGHDGFIRSVLFSAYDDSKLTLITFTELSLLLCHMSFYRDFIQLFTRLFMWVFLRFWNSCAITVKSTSMHDTLNTTIGMIGILSRERCRWHHMTLYHSWLLGQNAEKSLVTGGRIHLRGTCVPTHGSAWPFLWSFARLERPGRSSGAMSRGWVEEFHLKEEKMEGGGIENRLKAEENTIDMLFLFRISPFSDT